MSSNFIKVFTQNFNSYLYDVVSYINISNIVSIDTIEETSNTYFISSVGCTLKFTVVSEELTAFLKKGL